MVLLGCASLRSAVKITCTLNGMPVYRDVNRKISRRVRGEENTVSHRYCSLQKTCATRFIWWDAFLCLVTLHFTTSVSLYCHYAIKWHISALLKHLKCSTAAGCAAFWWWFLLSSLTNLCDSIFLCTLNIKLKRLDALCLVMSDSVSVWLCVAQSDVMWDVMHQRDFKFLLHSE